MHGIYIALFKDPKRQFIDVSFSSSKDRVPYLMHDHNSHFLRRTTDVLHKFPGKDFNHSTNLTWEELQELNAGDWFLKVRVISSFTSLPCML